AGPFRRTARKKALPAARPRPRTAGPAVPRARPRSETGCAARRTRPAWGRGPGRGGPRRPASAPGPARRRAPGRPRPSQPRHLIQAFQVFVGPLQVLINGQPFFVAGAAAAQLPQFLDAPLHAQAGVQRQLAQVRRAVDGTLLLLELAVDFQDAAE